MSTPKDRIPLRGSVRAPLPGARAVGAANPDQSITVTVMLRPRSSRQPLNLEEMGARSPRERQHMTREQLETSQVATDSEAALAASILARLRKKIAMSSRMAKALSEELVQKARQLRVTSPPTVWVK